MYRLIIVEDEEKILSGIMNLFPWENTGFEVAGGFGDGQQALDYIRVHPVDVVLTDVRMPVMDGITLAERLRTEYPETIIVFLTAYQDYETMHSAILHSVADYLVKPVQYDGLIACFTRIRQQLEARRPTQAAQDASYYTQIMTRVRQYVEENLATATLEEAASLVSLSPNYLSRLYKEHTGESFTDRLIGLRMEKAAALLRGIDHKLYEISHIVGYNSPKNFSRAFKKYYHMTPREFRDGGA